MPKRTSRPRSLALTDRIRGHPFVALLLLCGAVAGGLAAFFGHVKAITDFFTPHEDAAPAVRVQYYTLSGHALSLLLLGRLDAQLKTHLGGKPVVWQNEVFDELRILHNGFSSTFPGDAELSIETGTEEEGKALRNSVAGLMFLNDTIYRRVTLADPEEDASLGDPFRSPEWQIALVKDVPKPTLLEEIRGGRIRASRFGFVRNVSCAQGIEQLSKRGMGGSLLAHLTESGCRGLTFAINARYLDGGCGKEGWYIYLFTPRLDLEVAIVQNVTGKAIKINAVTLGSATMSGIEPRPVAERVTKMVNGKVGDGTLLPEDRLIIPLRLYLADTNPEETQLSLYVSGEILESELAQSFPVDGSLQLEAKPQSGESGEMKQLGTLPKARLLAAARFQRRRPVSEQDTPHVGTVLYPRSLTINGVRHEMHAARLGEMSISESYASGSCPHIYSESSSGERQHLGKILVGRDSAQRLGVNAQPAPSWPSYITVSEEDPETTFLHGVRVVCETPEGKVFGEAPTNAPGTDGRPPVILRRGDVVKLAVRPLSPSTRCVRVFVEAKGYYIPD